MSSFVKSNQFKYIKNLIIGVGASFVMIGALGKIQSYEWGGFMLTVGLITEAILFLMLGILPPEKDYYWDKLYPGLGDYNARIQPLSDGPTPYNALAEEYKPLHGDVVEDRLGGMLGELQVMSKSLSSLKALQEVDFSKTQDQIVSMNNFYTRMNDAVASMAASADDTKRYQELMKDLNKNLTSLNSVYANMLNAMGTANVARS